MSKCPKCGANVEITKFGDGTVLIRQDCNCEIPLEVKKKEWLS